jgi:SAM-dependent methyltransferase
MNQIISGIENKVFEIYECEVCGNKDLIPVLDLGAHPMCDDLVQIDDNRQCKEFPIHILFCENCFTAHQKYQVPKSELFPQTYHYRSRFTADVLGGMKGLVQRCEELFGNLDEKRVLDIGCNDGSLLSFFREKGAITIGVEPTAACIDAMAEGHIIYNSYLTPELGSQISTEQGKADFIVFTNVFAHIEDLGMVLQSIRRLMSETTTIVIENHYLGAVLEGKQFDTFYHEHPRTYSYKSFVFVAHSLGLSVSQVEFPARYGGNIRVFMNRVDLKARKFTGLNDIELKEKSFSQQFETMRRDIEVWRRSKRKAIEAHVGKNGKLAAKAFPGRAAILVKLLDLNEDLISAVYEKHGSLKIGHFVPGTKIPILSDEELFQPKNLSFPLLNLAWHISGEIDAYMMKGGFKGSIINIIEKEDFS